MARTKQVARQSLRGKATRIWAHKQLIKTVAGIKNKRIPPPRNSMMGGVMKPQRYRPGTLALREIRKYQSNTDLLIRKLPFRRLVCEIAQGFSPSIWVAPEAIESLQEAVEMYVVRLFAQSQLLAAHAKRITIAVEDLKLAHHLQQENLN